MSAHILGIHGHLPEKVETNEDLGREQPDWDMPRIAAKTGILARHIAAADETACDLGYAAAKKLLQRELVPAAEIDYLIFSTQTPDHLLPSNACVLQHRLQLPTQIGAIDISPGCAGFVFGLQLAQGLIHSRAARNVLLVTAETYSKLIHPRDRAVRSLFGDGATATLIGATPDDAVGLGEFVVGTDGCGATSLIVPSGGFRLPRSAATAAEHVDAQGGVRSQDHLFMDGQAIFAFTLNTVPRAIAALFEKSGLTRDAVDWYVFHQANRFMLENLAKSAKLPQEKMVYHLAEVGNTVSSSIPLAIEAYVAAGRIQAGQKLLLVGFGVGFSWAACVVTWG
ncbi:MAG: ketoacyl-ACP synthase III [Planctomycetota bacterium]|nr:ketoacyl-ACP synthase III [Planctomycetota bacterium]